MSTDRPVRDRALARAVAQAYGSVLEPGRYPVGVVYIEVPAHAVDVNVHPQKAEVRFVDGRALHDALMRELHASLARAFSVPALGAANRWRMAARETATTTPVITTFVPDSDATGPDPWRSSLDSHPRAGDLRTRRLAASVACRARRIGCLSGRRLLRIAPISHRDRKSARARFSSDSGTVHGLDMCVSTMLHAAAERVTFHRLRQAFAARAIAMQRLLLPEVIELLPAEVATLEEHAAEVATLGVELRAVGNACAAGGVQRHPDVASAARDRNASCAISWRSSAASQGGPSAERLTLSWRRWLAMAQHSCRGCSWSREEAPSLFYARWTTSTSQGTARTDVPSSRGWATMNWNDASVVERALRLAEERRDELLAIVGPTATGKTALAVALAERLGGEVVSADSVQIYREFDVGSGKPTEDDMRRAPHHAVGMLDPLDHVDAAVWAAQASRAVEEIRGRGKVPILCGGTFLWVKALLFGLAEGPPADPAARARHDVLAKTEGRPALHARLALVDPETARRLHPNDFVRVSRALEVHELTGKPMSLLHREHAFSKIRHRACLLAIAHDPQWLTERIRARVQAWLAHGWIGEVEALVARGYGEARAMGSVGYAQVRAAVGGALPKEELETAIVRATRVFARRQRTWLNHEPEDRLVADAHSSLGT